MKALTLTCAAAALIACTGGAGAQYYESDTAVGQAVPAEETGDGSGGFYFRMGGSVGASTLTNPQTQSMQLYNNISLRPETGYGKFALGLDLYADLDSTGRPRPGEWNSAADYLRRIWYARWGHKKDPLYVRLGALPNVTIGHGFIMGGYSNQARYPDVRTVGLVADADLGFAGFESAVPDINKVNFGGGRVYVRPLRASLIPLLSDFAIGVTAVVDGNPSGRSGADDKVAVFGLDAEQPLLDREKFSAILYADAAMMSLGDRYLNAGSKDHGRGFAAGANGRLFMFDYRGEIRSMQANFIPDFFDAYYEIDRNNNGVLKADAVASSAGPHCTGTLVSLYTSIVEGVRVGAAYETMDIDTLDIYPRVRAELTVAPSVLMNRFRLAARYERRNVRNMSDLSHTRDANTIMTAQAAYLPYPNFEISYTARQTYNEFGQPVTTSQIGTSMKF